MTRLRIAFLGVLALLTAAWLLSLPDGSFARFWAARGSLIYYSGVLSIGCMAVAVMLAARPVQIESALGGLDKFYRLHKWLGIAAVLFGLVHWLLEIVPRWMVGQGWLERPQRARAAQQAVAEGFDPFRDLRGIAVEAGEWAFYLLLVLVVVALWKRVPYHHFFRVHRLTAPVFLVLAFHSAVLMGPAYWTAPLGPLMALLLAGGTAAAVIALFRRIGHSRRAVGSIDYLKRYYDNSVLEVGVRLSTAWRGHDAGQFAFVTFEDREDAHPFSMSSAWRGDGRIVFSIKGLGDYTRRLPDRLQVGQAVTVEGPYGRFNFEGPARRQIWVGGGIGVTPFIARLEALRHGPRGAPADLVYSTRAPDDAFIANIRNLAERAGVGFHLLVSPQQGLLTLDRLAEMVPEWRDADLWFCGPAGFGQALRDAMAERGHRAGRFHQELFDMR